MHRFHRRLACLSLAGLLSLPLARTASAVSYSDLPESHWAYADMIHADHYSGDAMGAVRYAETVFGKN